MAESDFLVPVKSRICSLRIGPDLGEGKVLDLWLPKVSSRIPGSWGWVAIFYILRIPSPCIHMC